jgi:hypothetical protein
LNSEEFDRCSISGFISAGHPQEKNNTATSFKPEGRVTKLFHTMDTADAIWETPPGQTIAESNGELGMRFAIVLSLG